MIPIIIQEPLHWKPIEVPAAIVRQCDDYYPYIDAYNINDPTEELMMLDCYWHNMGYYDTKHPIPVLPYHPIVEEFE